jgi:hypothetical protein
MTLFVNLFGGPCAGKSTARAEVFAILKRSGVNCEEVYEFAKKLTWSERMAELSCQPYVFGKQLRDMVALDGQVDVVITDAPLFLSSYYYGKKYCGDGFPESFYQSALEQSQSLNSLNFFINRTGPYNASDRNQTEAEADDIARELREGIIAHNVPFREVGGDRDGSTRIASDILEHLGLGTPLYPTQEDAHAAFGAVFQHYKGGVYRVIEARNNRVQLEHLWPHPRSTHWRESVELHDYMTLLDARRFEPVNRAAINLYDVYVPEGQGFESLLCNQES